VFALPSMLAVLDIIAVGALVTMSVATVGIELELIEEAVMLVATAPLVDNEDQLGRVFVADALFEELEDVVVAVKKQAV